jgi:hypothetical protein
VFVLLETMSRACSRIATSAVSDEPWSEAALIVDVRLGVERWELLRVEEACSAGLGVEVLDGVLKGERKGLESVREAVSSRRRFAAGVLEVDIRMDGGSRP